MTRGAIALVFLALALAACGGGGYEDPILRLSAEESLEQGQRLMEQKKYARARDYLIHAFEVEPNSATGRTALLLVADAHFLDGGSDNYIKAEAKYRDYQNRFPTSERAAYVQFQIANSLFERMLKPDRDQAATRKALEAFYDLLRIYPTSEYGASANEQILLIKDRLAKSEYIKGFFHMRSMRLPRAAASRFEGILELYPDHSEMDKVLFQLGRAYQRLQEPEKAAEVWERLRTEHPESRLTSRIPRSEAQSG